MFEGAAVWFASLLPPGQCVGLMAKAELVRISQSPLNWITNDLDILTLLSGNSGFNLSSLVRKRGD